MNPGYQLWSISHCPMNPDYQPRSMNISYRPLPMNPGYQLWSISHCPMNPDYQP